MAIKKISEWQTSNNLGNLKPGDIMAATRSGATGGGVIPNDVLDSNGNINIKLTATASAVNYFTSTNAAAGGIVSWQASGASANIPINILTKGSSLVGIYGASGATTPIQFFNGTSYQHATAFAFSNTAASRTVTFQDANGTVAFTSDLASSTNLVPTTANTGRYLISNNGAQASWSTAVIASSFGPSQLLYNNGANNIAGLATANNAALLSNGTGVPSWVAYAGTGSPVLTNSATLTSANLVTPALGTPTAGVLSSCTGYPTAQLTGSGAGVLTFLATPSSANLATAVTDETGSGVLVFNTSPTISSPTVNTPVINGFTNGSSAAAGVVGEVLSSVATAVAITSTTVTNIGSISLTAGDWDVWGLAAAIPGTGTVSQLLANIGPTSASIPTPTTAATAGGVYWPFAAGSTTNVYGGVPMTTIRISGTTTYYMNAFIIYGGGTCTATSIILARRVR